MPSTTQNIESETVDATAGQRDGGGQRAISVVIPAHNAAATIGDCLSALAAQTVKATEVVVVDDGSTDGTAEVARRFGATVLSQGQAGAGAARNHGAREAHGGLLLFTDADCAPIPEWIERLVAAFDAEGVAAARGVCSSDQPEPAARFAQLEYDEKYRKLTRHATVDFVATYSAAYPREVFWRFGGFDEGFIGATSEDQELSFRMARRGLKIVFLPDAVVQHRHHPSLRGYVRRKFWIGYAKARVGRRHPGKLVRDAYTPQGLKLQVICLGLTGFGLALAPVRKRGLAVAAAGMVGFALSAIPLLRYGRIRDPGLSTRLPLFLVVRAGSLGAGFVAGTIAEVRQALR